LLDSMPVNVYLYLYFRFVSSFGEPLGGGQLYSLGRYYICQFLFVVLSNSVAFFRLMQVVLSYILSHGKIKKGIRLMARRRRQNDDPIAQLIGGLGVLLSMWMGFKFNSITIAGITLAFVLAITVGIAFVINSAKEERLRKSGIRDIDQMDGFQFERYLALLFRSQGYKTTVTSKTGDYGADLILEKNGQKIAVQAKRYSKNVGIEAVQQVYASLAHYGASTAWVVTNRDFTEAAYKLAASNGVRLINREALIDMILRLNPNAIPKPKQVIAQMPQKMLVCEKCGSTMVLRKGPNGQFYGCSAYPKCRHTKAAI
jgi:restriction system protein